MVRVFVVLALAISSALMALAQAGPGSQQTGDQFLDGIGETGLVARYVLENDAEDSSRNQVHATLRGTGAFVEDPQFRRVLLLTGDGSHLQLPGSALAGEDTISVTAWLFLPTGASGPLLDFGQSAARRLSVTVSREGVVTAIVPEAPAAETLTRAPLPENQWVHIAVVLDSARGSLTTYVDGASRSSIDDIGTDLTRILGKTEDASALYVGRSHDDGVAALHARLHDFRIYRVPLSQQQVATVRRNAVSGRPLTRGPGRGGPSAVLPTDSVPAEWALAAEISHVPDITVETVVGTLPRLPTAVAGVFRTDRAGRDPRQLRAIWPAPVDNSQVVRPGSYRVTGRIAGTQATVTATVVVKAPVGTFTPPSRLAEPFPLSQVSLDHDASGRETPFIRNRDKFLRGLAATNPDDFLYNFRDAFGQPQPAGTNQLEGWDNQTTRLRGHASGHYLTAIAQAYAGTTHDAALRANFLQKMNYLVDTLFDLARKSGRPTSEGGPSVADPTGVPPGPGRKGYDSNLRAGAIRTDYWNWGAGFISAYPPDQFIMLEKGATYGTQDSQIWAPYYTLHKILAGLLDSYEVAGNEKALEIAAGMGRWVHARLGAVPAETRASMWNRYIAGEYGGMNEVMARLFRLTGERRFLETAKLFDNTTLFFGNAAHDHGLARNVDTIRGKHANQHIPQITGALETFRSTRELPYYLVAANFWEMVNSGYMYSIGGVAGARNPNNAECFTAQPHSLWEHGFASGGQNETCATYNLLKLDRQLFMYEQTAKYMDHYERALYNHILASVAADSAANTYHVPLNPGAQKRFSNARMNGFTCCNGTALESNTKLQDTIYFRSADNESLYVNLFVSSTLDWVDRKVVVQQITDFPYADTSRLVVKGSGQFAIKVRVPGWATRGFFVTINGETQTVEVVPGSYLTLARRWQTNDTIELRMPFAFHLDPVVDQPNVASIFYGPVLLAAEESGPRTDWRQVALDPDDIGRSVTGDPRTLRFTIGDAVLKPFFDTYGRHSVYLHLRPR
jgi:uncharacterized protein